MPTNLSEMKQRCKEEWAEISHNHFTDWKLYAKLFLQVINAKGESMNCERWGGLGFLQAASDIVSGVNK